MAVKVIEGPSKEPVTLTGVKDALGIGDDDNSQDQSIVRDIKGARMAAEKHLGRALITQTLELALDCFPDVIELPRMPVQSITSIKYIDTDGAEQTIDSAEYSLDDYSPQHKVVRAYDYSWPTPRDINNAIKVRYVAGYGDAGSDVPDNIIKALLVILGNWTRFQAINESGLPISALPYAAIQLLSYDKVYNL